MYRSGKVQKELLPHEQDMHIAALLLDCLPVQTFHSLCHLFPVT